MLIGKRLRHFVRHELSFRSPRNKGPALPFVADDDTLDISSALQDAIDAKAAVHEIKKNDVVRLTKLELRPEDDMAIFLVRRRDEEASTQVFEDGGNGSLWKPEVTPKQAPAVSAHLFMKLSPEPGPEKRHRAILEEIPGLGRTYIQYVLQKILRPLEYEYLDKKGKPQTTYTIPSIGGIASETLGDALKGGSIKYVELVRPAQLDGLDMAGLTPHPQRMRLSVRPDQDSLALIDRISAWATGHDWANMRVQVETSDDRTKVVEIAREVEAADILFVRSEVISTKDPIEICTDEINEDLAGQAKERLSSDENW